MRGWRLRSGRTKVRDSARYAKLTGPQTTVTIRSNIKSDREVSFRAGIHTINLSMQFLPPMVYPFIILQIRRTRKMVRVTLKRWFDGRAIPCERGIALHIKQTR